MKRLVTVVVALTVLAAMVPSMAVAQPAAPAATDDAAPLAQTENATENDSVPPGAKLAGVIGAQQAEVRGAVDQRAFGLQVAAAASNQSKAQLLAQNQERLQERLDGLQERLRTLEQARENGSMSQAQYQARVTRVAAQKAQVQAMAQQSEQVAGSMPEATLQANGVNVQAIQTLQQQARDLGGQEVAEIARSIAGKDVGKSVGPPSHAPGGGNGPSGDGSSAPGSGNNDGKSGGGQAGSGAKSTITDGSGSLPANTSTTTTTTTTITEELNTTVTTDDATDVDA